MTILPLEPNQVHIGHCLDLLKRLPDRCIHSVITSPPYWNLRDYLTPPVYWPAVSYSPIAGLPEITIPEQMAPLGLEPDIWAFVGHLVAVFREVKRVLRNDGACWVNLGDTYVTSPPGNNGKHNPDSLGDGAYRRRQERQLGHGENMDAIYQKPKDLKMKDLAAIPWRVALALQADGWYLRSDIIWHKTNPMPESIKDRPTKAHEYVFLLSKNERYYFDQEAIRESSVRPGDIQTFGGAKSRAGNDPRNNGREDNNRQWGKDFETSETRNKRSVWSISSQPYPSAHFATFPEKLITPMVLASTSEYGCCSSCGNPWQRVVEKVKGENSSYNGSSFTKGKTRQAREHLAKVGEQERTAATVTTGWEPTCQCGAGIAPAIILDPFAGSGTTLQVAIKHRRQAIGFDNNETYATDLVADRLDGTQIQLV